jgi:NAD(P)-dependent dehydrogenase (short-subunit alcohol dehydrogenase family)
MPSARDRVVAITGAARGIGRATAAELARRGARVAIGDLDGAEAEQAAASIGAGAIGLPLDVADRDSFERFLEATTERLGKLDVLVNNAGIMIVGTLANSNERAAAKVLEVNVNGTLNGMKLAEPRLRAGGQIVNVVSASAWITTPALSVYAASKHAVRALTDSVRSELAPNGIAVTAIYPNVVQTDLASGTKAARGGKLLTPEEVGTAIADAVERPRPEVFIPRSLGAALRTYASLPPRGKRAIARALGLDALYTGVDPASRREYEEKLARG